MSFNGHGVIIPNLEELILEVRQVILVGLHSSRVRDFNVKCLTTNIEEVVESDHETLIIDLNVIQLADYGVTLLLKSHGFIKVAYIEEMYDTYIVRK